MAMAVDSTSTAELFDTTELDRRSADLGRDFRSAHPFPHIVVDGLLNLTPEDATTFPTIDWPGWEELPLRYQHNKRACADIERIPPPFGALIDELSRPRFLRALEAITGIDHLLPDPYLHGGGLHLSGPGGILSPHTDFHHYRAVDLYRRINVLIYLNTEWAESDGGCLTSTRATSAVRTIVPAWGRTVIFQTDDRSIHGFPVPVAEGKWRRSVALYYYTALEAGHFSGDETTYWREHGEQHGLVRQLRMLIYQSLMNVSRGISGVAHLANPNVGTSLFSLVKRSKRKRP